jgi:DNA-binding transcriptional LysR family regulator
MDQIRALRYFNEVAQNGNFTAAARKFNVPASSISRRIADLESKLGAQLLTRTTRSVALTEVGLHYFHQTQKILKLLEESDQSVISYQSKPQGKLKISSMVGFGERILLPILDEFSKRYEDITLDVVLSDEISKLDRDDVDIAIRGGFAPDERVVAIRLMDNEFIPLISQAYIDKYGLPKSTKELPNHRGLFFKTPMGPTPWLSEIDGQWQEVSAPAILSSNNGKWLLEKAISGLGIVMLPRWVAQDSINAGHLKVIEFNEPLNITQNQNFAIYMLYQKLAYASPKVKVAVDFIAARVKSINT